MFQQTIRSALRVSSRLQSFSIAAETTHKAVVASPAASLLPQRNYSSKQEQEGWIWEDDKEAEKKVNAEFQDYMDRRYQETTKDKKSRLLWQSRKRGISENCLLFSTFCQRYLHELSEKDLQDYDNLLNDYNNEWDIYYWMVKTKEVPEGYQTNVMKMLQVHAENQNKEKRLLQPELEFDTVEGV